MELTLADSIGIALENNRRLVNERLGRIVDQFALEVAESEFRPKATIGPFLRTEKRVDQPRAVDYGVSSRVILRIPTGAEASFVWDNSVREQDSSVPSDPYVSALTFTIRQPLLKGGGIAVGTASLETARRMEQTRVQTFRVAVMDVVAQVVRTYRSFVLSQRRLEISKRSLERARELLAVNRLLIQAGRMATRDIVQTEADIATRELALAEAENGLDAARLSLIDILDIDSGTQIRPAAEALAIERAQPDAGRSVELALRNRPDYLQALLRMEGARTRRFLARNNRLWDLSLALSAGARGAGGSLGGAFDDIDYEDLRVGLELSVPLGDLTPEQAYLEADVALRQADNELTELRQAIDIEIRNGIRDVESGFLQTDLARRSRELAEQKIEIEREKLNLGLTTNFQLVAFEESLVEAENREVETIISYLNALTSLDRTVGTILETWGITVDHADP